MLTTVDQNRVMTQISFNCFRNTLAAFAFFSNKLSRFIQITFVVFFRNTLAAFAFYPLTRLTSAKKESTKSNPT